MGCSTAMAGRVDGYVAAMAPPGRQLRYFAAMLFGVVEIFGFFLLGNFNGLFYAREGKRTTNSSTRKREREKESEKKKESFETCLVSLFSAVGSPPILALLVGSQQHKLPPASFFW
jgi:hypothetical protein